MNPATKQPLFKDYPFLRGGGEMGELIRSIDWSQNPLGSPDTWPIELKQTVSMMLKNSFPVLICWGPEYIQLYNDAFRPINGQTKHPQAMGGSARDTYAEIWETIGPMFGEVMSGKTHGFPNFMVPLDRNGHLENCYFDFSYSPIADIEGTVKGVLVICMETTDKVRSINELKESEERFRTMAEDSEFMIAIANVSSKSVYFNKAWLEFTGKPMEDLLEFGWSELIHPDDKERWLNTYLEGFENQVAVNGEFRIKNRNGEYRWLLASIPVRYNADGTFAGYISSCIDITDRKEYEQRLQQILNMLPASVVVIRGQELIVEMINQSNLDYWNRTADEVVGRPFLEILPDLADQPFAGQLRQVINSGEIIDVKESPVLFENEDGTIRETFVDYTYQPLTDINGNRTGVLVMSFEITDRVMARRLLEKYADELEHTNQQLFTTNSNLARSEERFKYLIQEAPVAIGVLNGRQLVIESANEMILRIWGKSKSIVGQTLASALPELQGQPFLQLLDDVYTTGKPFYGNEVRAMLEHNGELREFFFNFVYQPITEGSVHTTDILVVAVDVTAQVNARKEVERAEEGLRMAIDAADMGSYSIDLDDCSFQPSHRLKEFFGFASEDDMPYAAAVAQIDEDFRQGFNNKVKGALNSGNRFDMEYRVTGFRDGKVRWLRGLGQVQPSGGKNFFTGVLHNITERKQDELRKNDFIGMVSHELKTPLTSLNALLQVANLKLKNSEDDFLAGAVGKANIQVKRMTDMINGFLNISRLESGKIHIVKQDFDINDLITEIIDEAAITVNSHSISFTPCLSGKVHADRDKISSVISNLLSNAIKYSPKGKNIMVACNTHNKEIVVSIKDEGMGIKPDDLNRIFDRYYRVESNNTRHISGFGIGLYLSSEIINRHNGKVWAESESNQGSTFYFSLPL